MKATISGYSVFLHLGLVVLCGLTLVLASENKRLKRPAERAPSGPPIDQVVGGVRWQPLDAEKATIDLGPSARGSLLFVFTTDCSACRENQASWRTVYGTIGDAVDVYGISLSDVEATRAYHEALVLPFPVGVLVDPTAFVESLAITGVPLTLRLGIDGRVTGSWSGTLSDRQLSEVIGSEHG